MQLHRIAIAAVALGLASSPALAQTASSSAYNVSVNQTVTSPTGAEATVTVAPIGAVSGAAPPSYNVSSSIASANETATLSGTSLAGFQEAISTGLLLTNANGTAFAAEATATINAFDFGITSNTAVIPLSVLSLSATTIQSYSQANSTGGLDASGFTTLEGLTLGGSALGGLTINGSLFSNPAPNTVLFSGGGLSIILNEQLLSGDGMTNIGISTNAIAIRFADFALGTDVKDGSVIIGHTQAAAAVGGNAVVPEPAAWATMLLGLGAVGHLLRRRRLSHQAA
jgi:hypothetical protein